MSLSLETGNPSPVWRWVRLSALSVSCPQRMVLLLLGVWYGELVSGFICPWGGAILVGGMRAEL